MKRGSAIKYTRVKLGLKQRDLVSKTHSKSLISRIENNDSEVHEGHYDYFIEKLQIDLPSLQRLEEEINTEIEELFNHIHYLQLEDAKKQLQKLEQQQDFIHYCDYNLYFQIIKYFYLIQIQNLSTAETLWKQIQAKKIHLLTHEAVLAEYFHSIYLVFKGKFREADTIFTNLLNNEHKKSFTNRGDLYFYISKTKLALKEYNNAIFFATKAANYYNARFNYKRSILTAEVLINCHIYTEMYSEAQKQIDNLQRHKEILQLMPNEIPIVYHFQGSVYKKTFQIDKAIEYYKKSIEFPQPLDATLLLMHFNLCDLLFRTNDETCKEHLITLSKLSESIKNIEYLILAKFYLLLLENEQKAYTYIEPHLLSDDCPIKNHDARFDILTQLVQYYKQNNHVEKAMFYLEKLQED